MAMDLSNNEMPPKFKITATYTQIKGVQHHIKIKIQIIFKDFLMIPFVSLSPQMQEAEPISIMKAKFLEKYLTSA